MNTITFLNIEQETLITAWAKFQCWREVIKTRKEASSKTSWKQSNLISQIFVPYLARKITLINQKYYMNKKD